MNVKIRLVRILIIVFIVIAIIIGACCWFFSKRTTIQRIMRFKMPSSAEILEYTYILDYEDGCVFAAKIRVSKEDYERIKKQVSKKYSETFPEGEIVNSEKYRSECMDWWDLRDEDISEHYYLAARNPRPVKHLQTHSIYAVILENEVLLYLSCTN